MTPEAQDALREQLKQLHKLRESIDAEEIDVAIADTLFYLNFMTRPEEVTCRIVSNSILIALANGHINYSSKE